MTTPTLTPRLVVRDGAAAIDFYERAFGAEVLERYDSPDGKVVHAALKIRDAVVAVVDAAPVHHNLSPDDLGGTSVILELNVDDPDAAAAKVVEHGGEIVFPIDDRFYGHRDGRVKDPFGHFWIVFKVSEQRSPEAIQKDVDGFGDAGD